VSTLSGRHREASSQFKEVDDHKARHAATWTIWRYVLLAAERSRMLDPRRRAI